MTKKPLHRDDVARLLISAQTPSEKGKAKRMLKKFIDQETSRGKNPEYAERWVKARCTVLARSMNGRETTTTEKPTNLQQKEVIQAIIDVQTPNQLRDACKLMESYIDQQVRNGKRKDYVERWLIAQIGVAKSRLTKTV